MKDLFIIMMLGLITSITVSCDENKPTESDYQFPVPPPMTDVIPYGALGHGKIVFERIGPIENNYQGVYVIDIDAQTSSAIGGGVFDGVTISPAGEKIAYSLYSSNNTWYDIYVMNINGSDNKKISEIVGQEFCPSWTPDGQKILFIADELEPEYKTVAYIQSAIPNPPDRTAIKTYAYESRPNSRLSVSDNNRLVFTLESKGIYVMNIDGTNVNELISGTNYYSPVWSPNGSLIAFLSVYTDSAGHYSSMNVMLMNSDGSNPESVIQLSAQGYGEWAGVNGNTICWSPDGTKLLFNEHDGYLESHIYIINADGSSLTQVTFAQGVTDRSLSWGN